MLKRIVSRFAMLMLLVVGGVHAALAEGPGPASQPDGVSVAVLDYEGKLPGNDELGRQIAEILTVRLSMEDTFMVVERARLSAIVDEHKLTLTGLTDADRAARIGKLTGAKLLILGKAFMVDKKLMLATKVVGVETGQLKGTLREVDLAKPLSGAVLQLGEDVAEVIRKDAARLLPADAQLVDPLINLREKLVGEKGKLPKIAVVIPEEHRTQRVIDPAVESEIKKMLLSCGVPVVDVGENALAEWARKMLKSEKPPWPPALNDADYVLVGEAFSEFASRTGELVTCAARAEVNLIDRKTGQIVLADRDTQRAVDLAENIAGKTALQKVGRKLGLAVLGKLAEK